METRNCPICYQKHNTLARYKNAVCNACLTSYGTRDRNGNNKEFYNIDIWGGIKCIINEKEVDDFTCYVNNVKCSAQEARFGGIVILPDETVSK